MSNFVTSDGLIFMSKNPQHDCVKPRGGRGGGQGPFTQCVKKHPIWQRMASLIHWWLVFNIYPLLRWFLGTSSPPTVATRTLPKRVLISSSEHHLRSHTWDLQLEFCKFKFCLKTFLSRWNFTVVSSSIDWPHLEPDSLLLILESSDLVTQVNTNQIWKTFVYNVVAW